LQESPNTRGHERENLEYTPVFKGRVSVKPRRGASAGAEPSTTKKETRLLQKKLFNRGGIAWLKRLANILHIEPIRWGAGRTVNQSKRSGID